MDEWTEGGGAAEGRETERGSADLSLKPPWATPCATDLTASVISWRDVYASATFSTRRVLCRDIVTILPTTRCKSGGSVEMSPIILIRTPCFWMRSLQARFRGCQGGGDSFVCWSDKSSLCDHESGQRATHFSPIKTSNLARHRSISPSTSAFDRLKFSRLKA